ncbi:hypothetical protein PR048_013891 [Dryococelus australis]|uniref:Uncharacterized protein n=1 Tax=Dryococelus australis TaxID=614101 RepID=A0ABQ9HTG6_9NEOP|nr:hypothetical protein PR048_013891 [Dryococelus australis]
MKRTLRSDRPLKLTGIFNIGDNPIAESALTTTVSDDAGRVTGQVNKPSLWYYDLLSFVSDQQTARTNVNAMDDEDENQEAVILSISNYATTTEPLFDSTAITGTFFDANASTREFFNFAATTSPCIEYPENARKELRQIVNFRHQQKAKMRSPTCGFSCDEKCFICGKEADEEKEKKVNIVRCRKIRNVRTLSMKDSILKAVNSRKDEWGRKFFTLSGLKSVISGCVPDEKIIRSKLIERYKEGVIVSGRSTSVAIICFRDTQHEFLTNAWYRNRCSNQEEERFRILEAAALILRQDIRLHANDTKNYPPSGHFFDNVNESAPKSLQFFTNKLITTGKKGEMRPLQTKYTAINHAMIFAIRPQTVLSPIPTHWYCHNFTQKIWIQKYARYFFPASCKEAQFFKVSSIFHPDPTISPGSVVQFAFDNADYNVITINGLGTFHAMGGIKVVTPFQVTSPEEPITRLNNIPTAEEIGMKGLIPLNGTGLQKIKITGLDISDILKKSVCSMLWIFGSVNKFQRKALPPSPKTFDESREFCMQFVNAPLNNYDTILTVLSVALDESKKLTQKTCIVTFDQLLYLKARDIVGASDQTSKLSKIIFTPGGLYILMSFLDSIGYIMARSGLKEVLSIIHAPNSVDMMLTCHTHSRAVRGHLLLHLAMSKITFEDLEISEEQSTAMREILISFSDKPQTLDEIDCLPLLQELQTMLDQHLLVIENRGDTTKFWVQYFRMVCLVKDYIQAERTDNWKVHLEYVQNVIPYFHSVVHFLYAKSCRLSANSQNMVISQCAHSVCALYINYVRNNFGSDAVIVFDGYQEALTDTKAGSMTVTLNQENLLPNRNNKSRLIAMLKTKFEQEHFISFQAPGDADVLIVKTAIRMSLEKTAVFIGEDIYILVLLVDMAPTSKCIFFMKLEKDRTETKI